MDQKIGKIAHPGRLIFIVAALVVLLVPSFFGHAEHGEPLGLSLPLWSCIPFLGMLLSIAIFPLVKPHWWEHNLLNVAFVWSLVFLVPFAIFFGPVSAGFQFFEILLLDYLPFIVLLWGLFAVSGGIVLKGSLRGTPKVNIILLLIGTLLASWVGTTGASMLMIRPVLRANKWREKRAHVIVFFIFLVSNIGGCLTPIGDPPLFLGFLRQVPFFWTMRLLPMLIVNSVVLLVVFFFLDRRLYKKELAAGRSPDAEGAADGQKGNESTGLGADEGGIRVEGLHNLVFIAMIVGAVILSGILGTMPALQDAHTGTIIGIPFAYGIHIPLNNAIQMLIILIAGILSLKTTRKELHEQNHFTWGPIKEVASLFIGIFITMIPALAILNARGAELGLGEPWQFFWVTGALSSFLDNAPTYLVFMTTAAALPTAEGLATTVGIIAPQLLLAVSAGAVFMGANTYIGNAPNFMVRSIAEEDNVKMPSFFGYMSWSGRFLVPLFLIDTLIFFVLMQ
ncbi:MAG: sodium:proton antiporter [Clostridiales Family XIII bacterium]|jgi:Na+/H+ antiporter NhaD/arsenite permease-like protein|nr:sodium:proton antiporter [Clostridiales Family XIII bacterium]